MKKLFFLTVLVSGYCLQASAQNELEYARYLYKLNLFEINTAVTNTANHFTADEIAEWNRIQSFVSNPVSYVSTPNPKLDIKLVAKILEKMSTTSLGLDEKSKFPGSMGDGVKDALNGNIGAQFTNQLIFALSDLIIERAKAELTLQYFTKLKASFIVSRTLNIPKAGGTVAISFTLRDLFPNSYNALDAILADNSASIVSIGQSFKGAFEADMKQFYLVASKKFITPVFGSESYFPYLEASLFAVNELLKGSHPSIVIQSLAFKKPITPADDFSLGINLLYAISESLKNTTSNSVWVGQDAVDGLSAKEFLMYFCLLYQNNTTLFNHLGITVASLNNARDTYYPLIKQISSYASITQSFLQEINSGSSFGSNVSIQPEEKAKRFFDYAHHTIDLIFTAKELRCKSSGASAYCTAITEKHRESAHRIIDLSQSIQQKDYSNVFRQSFQLIEDLSGPIVLPPTLLKVAFMVSDVASADSVNQIKKILDGAILPVGSFRIKRQSDFAVHLNSYAGMAAGAEFLDGNNINNSGSAHFSPFVPVGLDVSWGKDKKGKTGRQSNGLFFSIVDLGAVVSYRIQNQNNSENKAEELPDVKWNQLLAPGIFYVHGIRDSPLSWGFGGNLNPSLREITSANNVNLGSANAFKISFFIAVDIPLFNISSR